MRDDPSDIALPAMPGWLAATATRECPPALRAVRRHDHQGLPQAGRMPPGPAAMVTGQGVTVAGHNAALRAAFTGLPQRRSPHLAAVSGNQAGDDLEVKEPRGEQGD